MAERQSHFICLQRGGDSVLKLVIAQDEEIIRRGLVCTFDWEKLGVVVVGDAEDGVEALELIHEKRPDVVLTDIRMPRLSGIDLTKRLQGEHRTVHVVFLTSYAESYKSFIFYTQRFDRICQYFSMSLKREIREKPFINH